MSCSDSPSDDYDNALLLLFYEMKRLSARWEVRYERVHDVSDIRDQLVMKEYYDNALLLLFYEMQRLSVRWEVRYERVHDVSDIRDQLDKLVSLVLIALALTNHYSAHYLTQDRQPNTR
jgi:hypothetical protein